MKWGFLPKGSQVAWGKQVRTVFSRQNLYSIKLFQELKRQGLDNKNASAIMQFVSWEEGHDYLLVTTDDEGFFYVDLSKKNMANFKLSILSDYKIVMFINLKALIRGVNTAIKKNST
jgi:hypothetical protein